MHMHDSRMQRGRHGSMGVNRLMGPVLLRIGKDLGRGIAHAPEEQITHGSKMALMALVVARKPQVWASGTWVLYSQASRTDTDDIYLSLVWLMVPVLVGIKCRTRGHVDKVGGILRSTSNTLSTVTEQLQEAV